MSIFNWIGKLAEIPARLTAVTIEKIVCGAYEVYDDVLKKRQSELNARFKAITDQEQIAIDGGTATIAGGKEDIVSGSGAITTANAVAGYCAGFMKGSSETVEMSEDVTFSGTVAGGGGWYGGGGGQKSDSTMTYCKYSGGGSGFVNTAASAGNRPSGYTGIQLDSGETKAGNTSFPSTSGGTETGHSGNGYAKITRLA